MRLQTLLKISGTVLLSGLLAACGSSHSPGSTVTPPASSLEAKFGSGFAAIFDASSTAQPATPDANSVPALAPAGQPIAVP